MNEYINNIIYIYIYRNTATAFGATASSSGRITNFCNFSKAEG